jgi:hypothetical protein
MFETHSQTSSKAHFFTSSWRLVAAIAVLTASAGCDRLFLLGGSSKTPNDSDGAVVDGRDAADQETRRDAGLGSLAEGGAEVQSSDAGGARDATQADASDAASGDAGPIDTAPGDTGPGDAGPGDADPIDAGPGNCVVPGNGHLPLPAPLFEAAVLEPLPLESTAYSVAIGDVTGDGRPDVVVGMYGGGGVGVYAQTPKGMLAFPQFYPDDNVSTVGPEELEVADLNGDGRLDVVYTVVNGIGLMLQNAAGYLSPPIMLPAAQPGANGGESALAVGDLNGDGRADVAAVGWGTDGIDVWFQGTDGKLAAAKTFRCPHNGYETLAAGDVDGDGLTDLAVTGQAQQDVCVLVQKKTGFAPFVSVPLKVKDSPNGLAIGNLGLGSCAPDIVFSIAQNSPRSALYLIDDPTSPGAQVTPRLMSYDIPDALVVADVDGDGRSDVVVMHSGWEAVGVYRQRPTGGLAPEEKYAIPYINAGPDRIAVGDVNGDGLPDIVGVDSSVAVLYHH